MNNIRAFTLIELVIVIVIVSILAIVAVPIYRGYVRKAVATEGKALVGAVQVSEKIYYAEFKEFYSQISKTSHSEVLDIDARANKYFSSFSVTAIKSLEPSFTIITEGSGAASGIKITFIGAKNSPPTMLEDGIDIEN